MTGNNLVLNVAADSDAWTAQPDVEVPKRMEGDDRTAAAALVMSRDADGKSPGQQLIGP